MSAQSPVRPARRAATRRKAVVESSDEDDAVPTLQEVENEEDYTPAPARSTRPTTRRTTAGTSATPQTAVRTRRTKVRESVEPSQVFSPSGVETPKPVPGTKNPSPRKRQSVRARRQARLSAVPDLPPPLPTPKPSTSPEPVSCRSTPLVDITEAALNMQVAEVETAELKADINLPLPQHEEVIVKEEAPAVQPHKELRKIDIRKTVLEKPMDIVIRTRAISAPKIQEQTGPKPRIVITYLILTNFKSYAGRQEVGPFHSSFSSVVGPNGSGKSNVIDSLLFVFGFRASKMRQGKISALIHNSAAFPDLDYCEVEVHFQEVIDQPTGTHVVPDSTLVISRKAFKNNASKYYINGSESNFTTVTTLLRDRGVDLDHKRFLILQGEVESIAQMKPKAANEHDDGLLEYLEDIIGTSKYKSPIEESANEAEALNEVCREKNSRVQLVEKEKNGLEDKKNKALAYIRDENELAVKQSALYQVYVSECGDNIQVTGEAVAKIQSRLDEELQKHAGSEEGMKLLERQYKKGAEDLELFGKSSQQLLKEMAKFDKETVKLEEKKKFLAAKLKKAEKSQETSRFGASEATSLIERCSDDIQRNTDRINDLELEVKAEEKELSTIRESLQGKTQGISDQIAVKQKALEPWQVKMNEKTSAIAVARSELEILLERDAAGTVAAEDIAQKLATLEESKAAKATELHECQAQLAKLQDGMKSTQLEIDKLAQNEPKMRSNVSIARQKADEARASLSNTQTQGNVLNGLMRLNDSGRINGFHGRLGNLGAIDKKYDIAISTACPSLDNLVVDSVEVGQQCIDYLRKNNLGRANIILLDRLAHRDPSTIETPENVPRLFDLVKSKDDIFRPAFYSVLQDTLVAQDLDQANRIAYGAKRWRVVTLDGQLIDKSGTMSGGGTKVARGAMSAKIVADISKDQVAKFELDRDSLEQSFRDFQLRQQELDGELRKIKEEIPKWETRTQKLQLELESIDRNISDTKRRAQELNTKQQPSKTDQSLMKGLEKTIRDLEREVEELRSGTSGIEGEIKALQDKIMEIGGVRLRGQKAKVDGLKSQIETLTEELSAAEVAKVKAEKQKAKHVKAHAEAVTECEGAAEEAEKVEQAIKDHMKDASQSRHHAEEAQEALQTKKEELTMLKSELDTRQAKLNETRAVEIDMRNKLEENRKLLDENQKRLRYWQDKISKLCLQNVNDLGEERGVEELPSYTRDELQDMDKETLKGEIAILEEKTQNVNVELGVLADYRRRVEEHAARSADLAEAVAKRDAAKKRCDELRRLRLEGFMEGFSTISLRLKEMYQMITMGGNAELELVDSLDPFSEGILFSVMPPKKSWKNISNLSGGEKTLSSLALVFALHHYKPTPLYVMDEIDAALDFRNVSIVASYIKERTKNAQFIVISLRNNMFELASRLVGVYKVNHMTKSVTIENRDYMTGQT